MRCPDCHTDLQQTDYRGVRIDECPKCRGRWFDRDELRQAIDRTDDDLRWLDFDPFSAHAGVPGTRPTARPCPQCEAPMGAISFAASSVLIDKCGQGHGVWLSHDELEKVVRYLEELVSSETASGLVKDAWRQLLEIATGPEGAMSEVRDLLAVLHLLRLRLAVEHPSIAAAIDKIYRYSPLK